MNSTAGHEVADRTAATPHADWGAGTGGAKAVVTPTDSSLLSDYHQAAARVKVFAAHRLASSVGQIVGPVLAGLLASFLGWRAPLLLFAVPTLALVPSRCGCASRSVGSTSGGPRASTSSPPQRGGIRGGVVDAAGALACAYGASHLGGRTVPRHRAVLGPEPAVVGLRGRLRSHRGAPGIVAAGVEPLQIVGVFLAMPAVSRIARHRPGFLLGSSRSWVSSTASCW